MSSGKLILLLIAMGMVGLVLLLGYKLDKYEEKGKRKEKITKKRDNKENDNSYTNFKTLKNDYDEMNQTNAFSNTSFDFDKTISKNDKYLEEFDKTAVIEKIDLSKLDVAEKEEFYENEYEEPELNNNLEEFEDEMYEEFENDEAYDYENSNSSTMVFDTTTINEELEAIGNVKGYDFEEEDSETSKKEVEKPKTTRKTATKKSTTKKTETKPKTTKKATTKNAEEKPKTTRKATTSKKTDDKVKKTRAVSVRKEEEKKAKEIKEKNNQKKTKTTTKAATKKTTKKATKTTKTTTKK